MNKKQQQITSAEKKDISNFLLSLNEKKYAQANKYLHKIVESKLNKKIDNIINKF
jgi:hypothetical protein